MLSTKKIMYKMLEILNVVRGANELKSATLASGVTGFVVYAQCGRMVTLTGVISITSAKSAGAALATGLPRPHNSWTIGNIIASTDAKFVVQDTGTLATGGALSAGTNNIRFAYSYLSNS